LLSFIVGVLAADPLLALSEKGERYKAVTVMSPSSGLEPVTQFDILVEKYTSESEILEYANLLKQKGVEPLKRTLEKVNVGRISAAGSVGTAVAIARVHQTDKGKAIRLVTARPMSRLQLRYGDGDQYPFTIMELYPEKGEGLIIGTVRPYFDEEGRLSVQVAGSQPVKLINVEQIKP
jgi:hypothetical protein